MDAMASWKFNLKLFPGKDETNYSTKVDPNNNRASPSDSHPFAQLFFHHNHYQ